MGSIFAPVVDLKFIDGSSVLSDSIDPTTLKVYDGSGTLRAVESVALYLGEDSPPPPGLTGSMSIVPNPVAASSSAQITGNAVGGTPPYGFAFALVTAGGGATLTGAGNIRTFTATTPGTYQVRMTVTDADAQQSVVQQSVTVGQVSGDNFPGLLNQPRCGMSAPSGQWASRLADVTPAHVLTRRIFGNFTSAGTDQSNLIEQAIAAGMVPVVSYKTTSADGLSAADQAAATAAGNYLASLAPAPVWALVEHEPEHQGWTAAQWRAIQKLHMPKFDKPNIARGFLHNAWLLDNRVADFWAYLDDDMMGTGAGAPIYEWGGIDTYQGGATTLGSQTRPWPADRFAPFTSGMTSRGWGHFRLVVGETNGYHKNVIADLARIFTFPQFCGMLFFNSDTGGKGMVLTHDTTAGDRLQAFIDLKNDARWA